jgi:hypothetical protein
MVEQKFAQLLVPTRVLVHFGELGRERIVRQGQRLEAEQFAKLNKN